MTELQENKQVWPERVEPPFMRVFRITYNIAVDIEKSLSGEYVRKFDKEHSRSLAQNIQKMMKECMDTCENGYEVGEHEVSFWLKFAMPIADVPEELRKDRDWHIEASELEGDK